MQLFKWIACHSKSAFKLMTWQNLGRKYHSDPLLTSWIHPASPLCSSVPRAKEKKNHDIKFSSLHHMFSQVRQSFLSLLMSKTAPTDVHKNKEVNHIQNGLQMMDACHDWWKLTELTMAKMALTMAKTALTMATMALKIASKNCQFASVEWAALNSRPN